MIKFNIDNKVLKAALSATAKDDVRFYLNGVFLKINKNRILIMGTNGHFGYTHRLSSTYACLENAPSEDIEIILQYKQLNNLVKSWDGFTTFEIDGNGKRQITATCNVMKKTTQESNTMLIDLIEGKYPNMERAFNNGKIAVTQKYKLNDLISPIYLKIICDSIIKMSEDKFPSLDMYQEREMTEVVIPTPLKNNTLSKDYMGMYVLMPMKNIERNASPLADIYK